jgi:hypothetical protein
MNIIELEQDGVDGQQLGLLWPSHRRHRVALDRFNETKLLVTASLSGSHPVRRTDRRSRPRPWRRLDIDSCRRKHPRVVAAASKRVDGNAGVSCWWVWRSAQGNNKASSYPCNCAGGVHRWRCFDNSAAAAVWEGVRVCKAPWFCCRRISAPMYTSWVRVYRDIWPGRAKPKQRWALESKLTSTWTFILYLVGGKLIAFWPGVLLGPQVLNTKTNWLLGLKKIRKRNRPGNNKDIEHEVCSLGEYLVSTKL